MIILDDNLLLEEDILDVIKQLGLDGNVTPETFKKHILDEHFINGVRPWYYISRNAKLTERFISNFSSDITSTVSWDAICKYQSLSETFIKE